jgi:hypothetical protein
MPPKTLFPSMQRLSHMLAERQSVDNGVGALPHGDGLLRHLDPVEASCIDAGESTKKIERTSIFEHIKVVPDPVRTIAATTGTVLGMFGSCRVPGIVRTKRKTIGSSSKRFPEFGTFSLVLHHRFHHHVGTHSGVHYICPSVAEMKDGESTLGRAFPLHHCLCPDAS